MTEQTSQLEEEIESWRGFPWALRKEDLELWNAMIEEVRDDFGEAVERSGKAFTTDPFFMALLLAQERMIRFLRGKLKALGVKTPELSLETQATLG
jgi:acetylornithine deacetylase/succinyl-diaminopimelate desuccinylase-like protein